MCKFQSITQSLHYLELHKYFKNVMSYLIFFCLFYCLWSNVIHFDKTWQTVETTFYLILLEESRV